jgi:hypothetical protein
MAEKSEKKEVSEKEDSKHKGTDVIILVDVGGVETSTTRAFYETRVEAFRLAGLTKK